jgi:hypothetical protein
VQLPGTPGTLLQKYGVKIDPRFLEAGLVSREKVSPAGAVRAALALTAGAHKLTRMTTCEPP